MKRTRNTIQRKAILDVLRTTPGHPTAADVFARVRAGGHPNLSLATVYRALHALVESGEIAEMRIDNVARYDGGPAPHHHVVCRICGSVADVPVTALPTTVFRRLEQASGFRLDGHHVLQLSGVCPACER
jgi:Fur family ferric uptake transcriptional regulator/Fur family peroxide stress response transcriptional regulator